jgi:hypothetical protein
VKRTVSFAKIFEDLFGPFDQRMKRFQNILEDTEEESDDEEVNDTNDENQYEVLYNNNFHTTTYSNLYADINFIFDFISFSGKWYLYGSLYHILILVI